MCNIYSCKRKGKRWHPARPRGTSPVLRSGERGKRTNQTSGLTKWTTKKKHNLRIRNKSEGFLSRDTESKAIKRLSVHENQQCRQVSSPSAKGRVTVKPLKKCCLGRDYGQRGEGGKIWSNADHQPEKKKWCWLMKKEKTSCLALNHRISVVSKKEQIGRKTNAINKTRQKQFLSSTGRPPSNPASNYGHIWSGMQKTDTAENGDKKCEDWTGQGGTGKKGNCNRT